MRSSMTKKRHLVFKKLARTLRPWCEEDGEFIHLKALKEAMPNHRWDLYLLGETASNRPDRIMRTQPLLGRNHSHQRVVVLMSSMRKWLTHYNTDKPETVEAMLSDLRQADHRYRARLKMLRAGDKARSEKPGVKPKPKPQDERPAKVKVTSNELFKVW